MEQLEKIFEVSNKLGTKKIALAYDGMYHFSVDGKQIGSQADYPSIVAEIKSYLLSQVNEMMGGESTPKKPKIQVEDKEADVVVVFKTRKEWSVGQQGDPRRNKRRGRKGKKSLTKSQILSFMRKTYNGKFSSELISYKQYVAEFSREYKKAYNREWWRANLGKGLEHYDKNDYRAIVKK